MANKLPTYGLDQLKSTDEDIKELFYRRASFYEGYYGYAYSKRNKLIDPDIAFKIFRSNEELQDEFIDLVKRTVRADLIDVLCYKYLKHYTYQKIADEIGIKTSSVGTKLTSARGEITKVIRRFDKAYIKKYADKIESKNETKDISEDKYVYVVIVNYNSGYLDYYDPNIPNTNGNISVHVLSDETKAHQYVEKFMNYFIKLHPDDWYRKDWVYFKIPNYDQSSSIICTYDLSYKYYITPIAKVTINIHQIKLDEFKIKRIKYEI